jgi:hypothetical protein
MVDEIGMLRQKNDKAYDGESDSDVWLSQEASVRSVSGFGVVCRVVRPICT